MSTFRRRLRDVLLYSAIAAGTLVLLGLTLPSGAQTTSVPNLAWACTRTSLAGSGVNGTCGVTNERWDYGDSGHLVAGCNSNCTGWQSARWVTWASNPVNVWVSRSARVPGPWADVASEGFVPRAQVALKPAAPAPPPPPPEPPAEIQPPGVPWEIGVFSNYDTCTVIVGAFGYEPRRIQAQRLGSEAIISPRAKPEFPERPADETPLTCADLDLEPGVATFFRFRMGNAAGFGPWTGYWPVLRFSAVNPDPQQRDLERIQYSLLKNRADRFTFQPTDAQRALCLVDGASTGTRPLYARNGATRGPQVGTLPVGPVTQNAGADNAFQRVECSCTDIFTFSNAVYARVLGREDSVYVAGCRHTGSH